MPINRVLLDTGPLVAFLARDDQHHEWACEQFEKFDCPLVTCEPVLTEAFHLLRANAPQTRALEELLEGDAFDLSFALRKQAAEVVALRRSYRDVPMSLADACLVRLSELHPHCPVLTLDSDFATYRRNRRDLIPHITPTRP